MTSEAAKFILSVEVVNHLGHSVMLWFFRHLLSRAVYLLSYCIVIPA